MSVHSALLTFKSFSTSHYLLEMSLNLITQELPTKYPRLLQRYKGILSMDLGDLYTIYLRSCQLWMIKMNKI